MSSTRIPASFVALMLGVMPLRAQVQDDARQKATFESLMDSAAKTIYTLAWPTAAYKSWQWQDFSRVTGGYRIVVKLNGLSAFDDSSLWLRLGLLFNSEGIKDYWVVDHNAILRAPFRTSTDVATLGLELAKQYSATHGTKPIPSLITSNPPSQYRPTAAGAVCIANETNSKLNYAYRWANGQWQQVSVDPRFATVIWWPYASEADRSSPDLEIEFDNSFEEGYTPKRYLLDRYSVPVPATCQSAKSYRFERNGQGLDLLAERP